MGTFPHRNLGTVTKQIGAKGNQGPTILTGLPKYKSHPEKLPVFIQGSHHKLNFRNIWVREL